MPLPLRLGGWLLPKGERRLFSLNMFHLNPLKHEANHAPDGFRISNDVGLTDATQTERFERADVGLLRVGRATDLSNKNLLSHDSPKLMPPRRGLGGVGTLLSCAVCEVRRRRP